MGDVKETLTAILTVSTNGDHEDPNDSLNEHDPHYDPIISLPEMDVKTLEEEEEEIIRMRAKLFRFNNCEHPAEWKERGTGEAKILWHKENCTARMVMRRDKTLKICANHFLTPSMALKTNCNSDRAWVWSVMADFADEVAKHELLAIRFASPENAKKWKQKFEEAQALIRKRSVNDCSETEDKDKDDSETEADKMTSDLKKLVVSNPVSKHEIENCISKDDSKESITCKEIQETNSTGHNDDTT